ncbi:MAG: DUF2203 domain-containing protein [Chloroflexota bacterium]|nr:DUF2203 domain-containing protein [Chloroflexota bacterium]
MADRHYTHEEAEGALPWVRDAIDAMRVATLELLDARTKLSALLETIRSNGGSTHDEEVHDLRSRVEKSTESLRQPLEEFENREIIIRDLQRGLIDFPALRDGREIYLCWLYGEDRIDFWHELDTGFAGRQPL